MFKSNYNYIVYWLLPALAAFLLLLGAMYPLIPLPPSHLVTDCAIAALLLSMLFLLARSVVQLVGGGTVPVIQKYINYGALGLLFILCWIGAEALLLLAFYPHEEVLLFLPTVPVRIVIALAVYALAVLSGENDLCKKKLFQEEAPPLLPETAPETGIPAAGSEEALSEPQEILDHIAVKNGQKIDVVLVPEIIAIQAEGDYVMIHTGKGKFLKEQTMKYFADHLPRNKFVRVHRSAIVNIDFIRRIEAYEKQQQIVTLHNNVQVKASAAGYKELKLVLNL